MQQRQELLEKKRRASALIKEVSDKVFNYKLKQGASRDTYEKLFRPVTDKLDVLPKAIEQIPKAIEQIPKSINKALLPPPPSRPITFEEEMPLEEEGVNLDQDIDIDVLEDWGLPTISSLLKKDKDDWVKARREATSVMRSIGPKLRSYRKKDPEEIVKVRDGESMKASDYVKDLESDKEIIKRYSGRLKSMKEQSSLFGKGFNEKYKISNDGQFGNLTIDIPQLISNNKLIARQNGGSIVLNEKVDSDLIDLITKRFNTNKVYSGLSHDMFKRLTEISGIKPQKRSKKYSTIIKGGCTTKFYNNPDELFDLLELITGSITAGNNGSRTINKGISIIDELLKLKVISGDEHEQLYKKYFYNI